jgi:hypothetical protein
MKISGKGATNALSARDTSGRFRIYGLARFAVTCCIFPVLRSDWRLSFRWLLLSHETAYYCLNSRAKKLLTGDGSYHRIDMAGRSHCFVECAIGQVWRNTTPATWHSTI